VGEDSRGMHTDCPRWVNSRAGETRNSEY